MRLLGIYFIYTLVFFNVFILKAQFNKAQELFQKNYLEKSIPFFKKALNTKHHDSALVKLAHTYFLLRNYVQAEEYYAQLSEKNLLKNEHLFNYAECLMANQKYKEAKKHFSNYSKQNPADKRGELMAKACSNIENLINQHALFEVSEISGLNSEHSDLSPTILNSNTLLFCSDKSAFKNYVSTSINKNLKTLNVYKAYLSSTTISDKVKIADPLLNKGLYNGPISYSEKNKLIAYNQVSAPNSIKINENKAQIYFAKMDDEKIKKPIPFTYNSKQYSCIHPTLSFDGQTLIFSSDMPGGFGGFDLYVSYFKNNEWSKPENLGAKINSAFDEVFPYLSKSNDLYFSSNGGLYNYGGLDIFKSEFQNNQWQEPENLKAPLNSSHDDFGICFNEDENEGYFTSNRPGGKGKDDIYYFKSLKPKLFIAGKLLFSDNINDPVSGVKLVLLTDSGVIVSTTFTDKQGFFKFTNLPDDKIYFLKLDDTDTSIASFKKIYLADDKNVIRKKTTSDKEGIFTFYNLPFKNDKLSNEIEDDTRISLVGSILYGENPAKPLSDKPILLYDDKGNLISKGKTDLAGSFKFEHLPPDLNYIVKLDETDNSLMPNVRIIITDSKGKTTQTFFTDAKGKFLFEILKSENNTLRILEEEDTSLRIEFKGKLFTDNAYTTPLSNTPLYLTDKKGKIIQATKTDAFGNFKFENIPSENNYLIIVEETDVGPTIKQIFVTDDKGKLVRKFIFEKGKFNFELLPEDKQYLTSIYVEDPWLKLKDLNENKKETVTVIENIYYEYGKWNITPEGAKILDKVVNIMNENKDVYIELSSHTDSRSSAKFNLELSQKRAKSAVDYIVSKGIASDRIKGIGKGETELVNYCSDGVECTEEQHAQNRRTEFKVVKKPK